MRTCLAGDLDRLNRKTGKIRKTGKDIWGSRDTRSPFFHPVNPV
jgi:hypothetical protein